MRKKGELVWDTLIPWIVAVLFLVLAIGVFMVVSGRAENAINYLKNLLRFGK